jgi:hypothetical protein
MVLPPKTFLAHPADFPALLTLNIADIVPLCMTGRYNFQDFARVEQRLADDLGLGQTFKVMPHHFLLAEF